MLYDPRWEQKTKPNPFSFTSLIAWLEMQEPSTIYRYECSTRCLLALYFTDMGYREVEVDPEGWFRHGSLARRKSYPLEFDRIAVASPRTFGAAAKRAREMAGR